MEIARRIRSGLTTGSHKRYLRRLASLNTSFLPDFNHPVGDLLWCELVGIDLVLSGALVFWSPSRQDFRHLVSEAFSIDQRGPFSAVLNALNDRTH